jgi:hypothetical protein
MAKESGITRDRVIGICDVVQGRCQPSARRATWQGSSKRLKYRLAQARRRQDTDGHERPGSDVDPVERGHPHQYDADLFANRALLAALAGATSTQPVREPLVTLGTTAWRSCGGGGIFDRYNLPAQVWQYPRPDTLPRRHCAHTLRRCLRSVPVSTEAPLTDIGIERFLAGSQIASV